MGSSVAVDANQPWVVSLSASRGQFPFPNDERILDTTM